ncbi:MAG: ABC transporter permease [Candidatus Eremiobacteraeota bacterium]|nr:ABC transporter permease [Candidatus Eremiobacteraeota bacterium]
MNDVATVFAAEFARRIKSRPFLIGLVLGIAGLMILTRLPSWLDKLTLNQTHRIILAGDATTTERAAALLKNDYTIAARVTDLQPDVKALEAQEAAAEIVLVRSAGALSVTVYARDPAEISQTRLRADLMPMSIAELTGLPGARIDRAISFPLHIRAVGSKFVSENAASQAHALVFTLIFVLYLVVLINSQLIMSSVAEEKTSRIAELLVATVDPMALLAGKILASAALALIQLVVWIAVGAFASGGQGASPGAGSGLIDASALFTGNIITPATVLIFFGLFVLALLQLSTMFAGVASMINRTEDLGSLSGPLVIPVVFALFAAMTAVDVPNAPWAVACSFIPVVSPFVLVARIAVSNVPGWEIALAFLANIVALGAIVYGSAKLYRVGMLLYGRSPSPKQIWRTLTS